MSMDCTDGPSNRHRQARNIRVCRSRDCTDSVQHDMSRQYRDARRLQRAVLYMVLTLLAFYQREATSSKIRYFPVEFHRDSVNEDTKYI